MSKRILLLLVLLVVIVVISFLDSKDLQIGIYVYDMNDFYMINYVDCLSEELSDLGNFYIHDAKNSQILQNEAIIKEIEQLDILIVNPVDRLSAYALIRLAELNDIPIIFINRQPLVSDLNSYEHAYYVGSEASQSAKYQAELISDLFGGDGNNLNDIDMNNDNKIQLLIFKGQRGHQDAEDRTNYLKKYLSEFGYEIDLVDIKTADWSKDKAKLMMTDLLEDATYLEAIACNNDYMALGVIEAIEAFNAIYENKVTHYVLGIDGMEEAIEAIELGKMYGTVFNDARGQVLAVKKLLIDELIDISDVKSPKFIWIDYKLEYE